MVVFVFSTVRDRKKRLAAKLLECARYLQPGIWFLREPRIAHYALVRHRPASLLDTKSLKSSGVRGLRGIVHHFLFAITPPYTVLVRHERTKYADRPTASFPIFVLAKSGESVLIDHARGEVCRLREQGHIDRGKTDIRQRLSHFFEVPTLEIMDGGKEERETYLEGQSFVTASSRLRVRAARTLLRQYEELTIAENRPAPTMFWEGIADYAKSLPLPEFAFRLADAVVSRGIRQLPLTPAHGDLSGFNILLKNDKPRLIDLADCAWLPAYFDFFFLNHQELLRGRSDLWRYFIIGEGWASVEKALSRSGAESIVVDRNEWLVTSFLLECFLWSRSKGAGRLDEPTLRKWWLPIGEVLTYLRERSS